MPIFNGPSWPEKSRVASLVELYLKRIKTYNNTCVNQPMGILGPITTIPHARQINALSTLNLRPAARKTWGFDERKARSMTDMDDNNPNMPDALEVAAAQDRQFKQTGKLVGPLHGVVMAIKDQYDTFDMRTTSGADAAVRQRSPSRGCHLRQAAAGCRSDHSGQGKPGRIRNGRRAQFLWGNILQSVRHGARTGHVERGLGGIGGRKPGHLRDR